MDKCIDPQIFNRMQFCLYPFEYVANQTESGLQAPSAQKLKCHLSRWKIAILQKNTFYLEYFPVIVNCRTRFWPLQTKTGQDLLCSSKNVENIYI